MKKFNSLVLIFTLCVANTHCLAESKEADALQFNKHIEVQFIKPGGVRL